MNYYHIRPDSFILISQNELVNITASYESQEKNASEQFYKYSPDNTKILDLFSYGYIFEKDKDGNTVSYGGEVDNQVSVIDLENKIWKRILFIGPSVIIEDGFWISDNEVLIVGQLWVSDNDYQPVIWYVKLDQNKEYVFNYRYSIENLHPDYLKKIKFKNIIFK